MKRKNEAVPRPKITKEIRLLISKNGHLLSVHAFGFREKRVLVAAHREGIGRYRISFPKSFDLKESVTLVYPEFNGGIASVEVLDRHRLEVHTRNVATLHHANTGFTLSLFVLKEEHDAKQ